MGPKSLVRRPATGDRGGVSRRGRSWLAAVAAACALGGAALVLAQQPLAAGPQIPTAPVTETSTLPYQAPPPPIMLPGNQVPCMGWAPGGCESDNPKQ